MERPGAALATVEAYRLGIPKQEFADLADGLGCRVALCGTPNVRVPGTEADAEVLRTLLSRPKVVMGAGKKGGRTRRHGFAQQHTICFAQGGQEVTQRRNPLGLRGLHSSAAGTDVKLRGAVGGGGYPSARDIAGGHHAATVTAESLQRVTTVCLISR